MNSILDAAKFIADNYPVITKESLGKLKLHHLLYCMQRESLAMYGKPAFNADFEASHSGPVSPDVASHIKNGRLDVDAKPLSPELTEIARNVIRHYGGYASWRLKELVREEYSCRHALISRKPGEKHPPVMPLSDIRKDAEAIRPYNPFLEMYYDELQGAAAGGQKDGKNPPLCNSFLDTVYGKSKDSSAEDAQDGKLKEQ